MMQHSNMLQPPDLSAEAPWKARFRAAAIPGSAIAAFVPTRGIVASNQSGTQQWYAWDVPSGALRQLTHTPGGHPTHLTLAPDARFVYYLQDEHGNEIGHYVRLPYAGGTPEDITPNLPPYSSIKLEVSRNSQRVAFIASYDNQFKVYVVENRADVGLGEPRLLHTSGHDMFDLRVTSDGDLVIFTSSERSGKTEYDLLAFDVHSGEQVSMLSDGDGASIVPGPCSPILGDNRLLAATTRSGIERLLLWDARAETRTDFEMPDVSGAVYPVDWSPDGRQILFVAIDQAETRLYRLDLADGSTHRLDFGTGVVEPLYFTPDGEKIYAHWQDASHPTRLVTLDFDNGTIRATRLAGGEVPSGRPWQSVSFPSSDGEMIQAWVAVPEGSGPFPTILHTHGGPTGVQRNVFSPGAQAWLDHGFAYCSVNYRGSTTFGYEFEQKIFGRLGDWEMEDMVAARHYLVSQGIAQPDAILLTGASYGGYLTLLGLGRHPELWAGGMALVAIADWFAMYADAAEWLRGYQRALFGGTPEEVPEAHRKSSPITYAEHVQSPILVIQGRNDTRTPARQLELYERRMRELGKEITVHWFESGHIGLFTDVEAGILTTEHLLRFAHSIVGALPTTTP